ncbi:MAG: DUF1553 domain-containing protein [Blastocatellales bacterium]|nr:DUF1553 domain-containing protein [Blastocatellales bacterium]
MRRKLHLTAFVLAAALAGFVYAARSISAEQAGGQAADRPIDFSREIRPILSDNCFTCHGPDEQNRMARLRLDTRDGAFAKAGILVAGDPAASRLYARISASDPALRMPPADSGHALTPAQIELIRKWIVQGARWSTHWAYETPKRHVPPEVRNSSWVRQPVDRFILARLEREGLRPSPEADKVTLLRRATLDLTGLPPTPADIDAFLADASPDAYERRVDQLLASKHYGERMAMMWLDPARYADTHGYHIDSHRDMWPWRDWLIRAFNNNLPYDRFTIEQLAGDMLPGATLDQKIASGFNRNHMINYEGGAIPEEYLTEYVVDRVEATATTWMGMTMGCARCHTHKYDPITHREFYQFFAFFNNVPELGLDGKTGNARPMLQLPTEEQKARRDALKSLIGANEKKLSDTEVAPFQETWEKPLTGRIAQSPREGLVAHYDFDGGFADLSGRYRHGRTVRGDPSFSTGAVGRAVFFDGDSQAAFDDPGIFDRDSRFSIAFWIRGGSNHPVTVLQKTADAASRRGWEFTLEDRQLIGIQRWSQHLIFRAVSNWPEGALVIRTEHRLPIGQWHHVAIVSDGAGRASGFALYINGQKQKAEILRDNLAGSIQNNAPITVGDPALGRAYKGGIDDLRFYNRTLEAAEIEQLAVHFPVEMILSGVFGKRSREETTRVREYFLERTAPDSLRITASELKRLKREQEALEREILNVMVMAETVESGKSKPRETWVLGRGDYRNPIEKVTADVPAVLPPMPNDAPRNRLTLARWLVEPGHPLTARVAVNRFWAMLFGAGIVKTVEDFGSQGEPPVHPELLDYLATEFVASGWDVKGMLRMIVTSAAYRQSSKAAHELMEKDPENRLIARGPRHRLQAESIRDVALAASGLLNRDIGGPSVFPYQPPGLWEELAFGDGFSAQEYQQSSGAELYRRSMYTFWKRTSPPATMAIFDAPDREKCTARRPVTNTPLQALALLNDPTFVEAARALASRALLEAGRDANARLQYAFRLATARHPSTAEINVLKSLLEKELRKYRRDRESAQKLLKVGESVADERLDAAELAAWSVVASAILNLDETITKE